MCYWKEKVPESYSVKRRFPCFLLTEGEESKEHIYGLPSNEYPGLVKVCHSTGLACMILEKRNYIMCRSLKYSWHYHIKWTLLTIIYFLMWFHKMFLLIIWLHCSTLATKLSLYVQWSKPSFYQIKVHWSTAYSTTWYCRIPKHVLSYNHEIILWCSIFQT